MARMNTKADQAPRTHEGGSGFAPKTKLQELERSVMACFLWEDSFYESGEDIAKRIHSLALQVNPVDVAAMAVRARNEMKLRHAPLLLLVALCKTGAGRTDGLVSDTIAQTVRRADEPQELLALYRHFGNGALSKQLKLGLAKAISKFDEYQFAKYNREGQWRPRDVLFMTHAKPVNEDQAKLYAKLAEDKLATPDTWETNLSAGSNKKETFTRLIEDGKLGYLALLRNLRNMEQAGVDRDLVMNAIRARKGAGMVLPFRFLAAAKHAPSFEPALQDALLGAIEDMPKFPGRTVVLVDGSGSMDVPVSNKSVMTRAEVGAALATMINGDDVRLFAFATDCKEVPYRRGLAGVDAIRQADVGWSTAIGKAIKFVSDKVMAYDRIIVVTDEQSHDSVGGPPKGKGYFINVAAYKNGVGYGPWNRIDGFSEGTLRYIAAAEGLS